MYEALLEFGVEASRWLQASYPQIAEAMALVSDFGRFEAYLLLLPLIYWCINKRLGAQLTYLLVLNGFLNTAAKHLLRQPRPFWVDSTLTPDGASGYGAPSGHVQTVTVLLFFLAGRFRENWLWLTATIVMLVMAISRVYLGVHFVHDIVAGFAFAVLILIGYVAWDQVGGWRLRELLLGQRLLVALVVPMAMALLYAAALYFLGEPTPPAAWRDLVQAAEGHMMLGVAGAIGGLLGLGIGFTLESSRVGFKVSGSIIRRLLRYVVGAVGMLLLFAGLEFVFSAIASEEVLWLAVPLRFLRDLLVSLWISYYAPMFFVFLTLADFSAEPEIPYSIRGQVMPIRKD